MLHQWSLSIPELTGKEKRRAWAYVPDGVFADPERRYPVLYMFDGQNLFADKDATYGKCWGILDYLTAHNIPLIVAAIECSRHAESDKCGGRLSEYSPFDFSAPDFGGDIKGRGEITMEYFTRVFKPWVDAHFPTLPDREHTFIAGSSMGGLMTLYALMAYNDVFSRGAALSPSSEFDPEGVRDMIRNAGIGPTVLYMDMGEQELRRRRARKVYADVTAQLIKKGVMLTSRLVPGGFHAEASWERQLPFFIPVLFYGLED